MGLPKKLADNPKDNAQVSTLNPRDVCRRNPGYPSTANGA